MIELPISNGRYVTLIDDEDEAWVTQWKWHGHPTNRTVYVQRSYPKPTLLLHRALLDAPRHLQVDHRDTNGLNNQRSNLRLATSGQNAANRRFKPGASGVRGVIFHQRSQRWRATILGGAQKRTVGAFRTFDEAVAARLAAEVEYYGDFVPDYTAPCAFCETPHSPSETCPAYHPRQPA